MIHWERRLAVLGSPIGHSLSPALHRAAYRMLGLDWGYGVAEVAAGHLKAFLDGLDDSWRGLSLTMPLKREVLPLLGEPDAGVELVGAANTVLLDDGRILGFNTDVYGAGKAIEEVRKGSIDHALLLGSGATAASVLAALAVLGVTSVRVATRSPGRTTDLVGLAGRLGVNVEMTGFEGTVAPTDLVVSTLPGTAGHVRALPADLRASVPLLDIANDPRPPAIAQHWLEEGGTVRSGLGMLLHQAHAQVRVFVNGDPLTPLENDDGVLAAMREALERP